MTDIPSQRIPDDEVDSDAPEPTAEEKAAAAELTARIHQYTADFFALTQSRHEMGSLKYGPVKFAEANTLVEAMEEVADLANYAMYTYIKLRLMNEAIDKMTQDGVDVLGPQAFMKAQA